MNVVTICGSLSQIVTKIWLLYGFAITLHYYPKTSMDLEIALTSLNLNFNVYIKLKSFSVYIKLK